MKKKILRVSTVPLSLNLVLKGQLRMLNEEYDVVAVSSPGEDLQEVARREGVRTVELTMARRISLWQDLKSLIAMIRLIRKERPWMVHSLTPKAGLLTMTAGWLCRVPVRIHTFTGLVWPVTTGLKRQILLLTDRITCACATVINPEGLGVKRDLEQAGVCRKPGVIIANGNINGIDLSYFSRTPEVTDRMNRLREQLNPKGEKQTVFCFVGRIVGDKGINELVEAFGRIYREHPDARLLLVGPFEEELDPVKPETRAQILSHPGIECTGWQDDVRSYLAYSHIFVFPSYREGFPNVLIQAHAMGLPAIATDINGCNEIVRPGENGVIIPSHDAEALYNAMKEALENPERWATMASKARPSAASRYDRQMLWPELLKFYHSLEK